jgi:thiamine phosphate synthase YjbQ (UPF0047 family)
VNDDESGLHQDYDDWLEELAPHEPINQYRHNRTGEDNADAHMKRQITAGKHLLSATLGVNEPFGWGLILAVQGENPHWLPPGAPYRKITVQEGPKDT